MDGVFAFLVNTAKLPLKTMVGSQRQLLFQAFVLKSLAKETKFIQLLIAETV